MKIGSRKFNKIIYFSKLGKQKKAIKVLIDKKDILDRYYTAAIKGKLSD